MLPQFFVFKSKTALSHITNIFARDKFRELTKAARAKLGLDSQANSPEVNSQALVLPDVDFKALAKTQSYHMEVYDDLYQVEYFPLNLDEIEDFINSSIAELNNSLDNIMQKMVMKLFTESLSGNPYSSNALAQTLNPDGSDDDIYYRLICYFANPKTVKWEVLKLLESIQDSTNELYETTLGEEQPLKLEIVCLGAGAATESVLRGFIRGEVNPENPDQQQNPPQPLNLKLYCTGGDSSGFEDKLSDYEDHTKTMNLIQSFKTMFPSTDDDEKDYSIDEYIGVNVEVPPLYIGNIGLVFGSESSTVEYREIFTNFYPDSEFKFIPAYKSSINEKEIAEICKRHEAQLATPIVFKSPVKNKAPRVAPMVYWFSEARTFNLAMKYLGENFINSQKPVILLTPSVAKLDDSRFELRRIKSKLDSEFPSPSNPPCYDPVEPMSFIMEQLTSLQDKMIFSEGVRLGGLSDSLHKFANLVGQDHDEEGYYNGCELYQIVKRDEQGSAIEPTQQFPIILETKYFSNHNLYEALRAILRAKYYY